jgi:hypothetical protein
MNWIEPHWVVLHSRSNTLHFVNDEGQLMVLQVENKHASLRLISALQLKSSLGKVCKMYVAMTLNEGYLLSLEKYSILSNFVDVFPNELPGLPPKCEIDFSIKLNPGT